MNTEITKYYVLGRRNTFAYNVPLSTKMPLFTNAFACVRHAHSKDGKFYLYSINAEDISDDCLDEETHKLIKTGLAKKVKLIKEIK